MYKGIFILCLSSILSYGCKQNNCKVQLVIPIDKHRVLVKEIDKCANKVLTEKEGILYSKDSLIPDGYYKEFYSNGKLKTLGYLKNGNPDSIAYEYYSNGSIKDEYYRKDGQASGPQYEFYENGQIEQMFFLKDDSTELFTVYNNKDGRIDSLKGSPVHLVLQPGYDNLKMGQFLSIVNIICLYDGTHGTLEIKLLKDNKTIWDTTVSKFYHYGRQPYFIFKHRFDKRGNYKYIAYAKIWGNNMKLIKADSEVATLHAK